VDLLGGHEGRRTKSSCREIAPQTVLIVEDDQETAEPLGELLKERGHRVTIRCDPADALETVLQLNATVAILDLGLPDVDGCQLAETICSRLGPAAPRLIALTGHNSDEARARCQRAGFAAHLAKPVDLRVLFRAVEAAVSPGGGNSLTPAPKNV
jgi:CheY-like chemotaxis protein